MTRVLLALCLPLLAGCGATYHSPRNAPGDIDLEEPPANIRQRALELPRDPGEHQLIWTAGGLGGLETRGGGFRASAETSLLLGWDLGTHLDTEQKHAALIPSLSSTYLGMNTGWTAGTSRSAPTRGYAELQLSRGWLASLAGGWSWEPSRHLSGPQVTGSIGPVYLRTTTMLTSGTSVEIGLVIKLPLIAYVWSR